MTLIRDAGRPLAGKRVALVFGPGNVAIDYAAALVRGPERALLELGASVDTFTFSHYLDAIVAYARDRPPHGLRYPEGSPLPRGLVDFFESGGPYDLTLAYFYDIYLTPSVVETLRRRGGRLVNYPLNLLDQSNHFADCLALFDETWCAEEDALALLSERFPRKLRYVPMASDPWIFRPLGEPARPRLLFVGSAYADRAEQLARCAEVIPTTVSGSGFDLLGVVRGLGRRLVRDHHLVPPLAAAGMVASALRRDRRPIGDEHYVRLAAQHGVSVGFSDVKQETTGRIVHKVRLREYDATMTGQCHLARRLPELQRHFEEGREILLYDDPSELPGLLRRIVGGELDWRAIGRAARARAAAEHTWTVRFREALKE